MCRHLHVKPACASLRCSEKQCFFRLLKRLYLHGYITQTYLARRCRIHLLSSIRFPFRCRSFSRGKAERIRVRSSKPGEGGGEIASTTGDKYLYEHQYGLPVVRRKLSYSELLRAIREERVEEVLFFRQPEQGPLEGPCLISFRNGTTAQSIVLPDDARLSYAMEAHDVRGRLLPRIPEASELFPPKPIGAEVASFLVNVLPYLAVLGVYVATSIVKWRKGDAQDRIKIKQKEAEARKRKMEEEKADRFLQDAEILAAQGWTIDEIMEKVQKAAVKVDRDRSRQWSHERNRRPIALAPSTTHRRSNSWKTKRSLESR